VKQRRLREQREYEERNTLRLLINVISRRRGNEIQKCEILGPGLVHGLLDR
jgi:hypothetical protein